MDLDHLNAAMNEIDEKNRAAIIKVINLKTESDMEKVLSKMETTFLRMESMFAQMNMRFTHLESKMDSKFAHVEDKISMMKWVMAIAGGTLTLVVAFLAFKMK